MESNRPYQFKKGKPVFFLFMLAGLFGISAAVMYLWNAILPGVTGLKAINYWQAMGIFVLSRLLFGHFGFGGRHRKPMFDSPRFKEKLMDMTEEEKERFKNEWSKRCS